jgi:Ca2+-binding RTX toxin-like protein
LLNGTNGADTIDGGLGIDTLIGGTGDDTYLVTLGDVIKENADSGTDIVLSNINWTLAANLENLTLTGTAAINGTGNDAANLLTGNAAANKLMGLAGMDTLLGGDGADTLDGGLGADILVGGMGNDTYIIDNLSDIITEHAGGGSDIVHASISYTLLSNIENLTLTGTAAINGTGNAGNNTLTGNSAANKLFGLDGKDILNGGAGNDTLDGGLGADTMTGGKGNDTYWVDNSLDVIKEVSNQGNDLVNAKISYTLGNHLENLTLTGTATINATGNAGNNTLTGNGAANKILGKEGADILFGS